MNSLLPAFPHLHRSETLEILLFCSCVLKKWTLRSPFLLRRFLKKRSTPEAHVILTVPLQAQRRRARVCTQLPLCLRLFSYSSEYHRSWLLLKAKSGLQRAIRQLLRGVPVALHSQSSVILPRPGPRGSRQLIPGSLWSSGRCRENKFHGMHLSRLSIDSFRPHTGRPCRTAVNTACDRALAKRPVVLQWIQMGLGGEQLCVNRKGELPPASSKTYHSTAK